LRKLDGVYKVSVNLPTEKGSIEYDSAKITVKQIIKAVKDIGYGAEELQGLDTDREKEAREKDTANALLLKRFKLKRQGDLHMAPKQQMKTSMDAGAVHTMEEE
ncbi:MAG: heavy-metal-associated domain-containing protein, partial [ANME-2 cluster archaeon]